MLNSEDRDFWSEIKRIRAKPVGVSRNVDGVSDNAGISKLFRDKYQKLYSCVSYNEHDMRCIKDEISSKIASENCSEVYRFTVSDIRTAVCRLKPHKSDGAGGLSSDYVLNAGDDCYVHFALLFNAIVVHGNLPDNFLYSTIIPIPKGRNANSCDSSNYRGIALSSIFSKVFDNLVLLKSLMNFLLAIYNLVLSLGVLPICVVLY